MTPTGVLPPLTSFVEWQGQRFDLPTSDGATVALTLASVQALTAPRGYEAFSLIFLGPAERPLAQDTYRFTGPVADPIDLFVVPVAQDADGLHYQAIVNRPAPDDARTEPPGAPPPQPGEERP